MSTNANTPPLGRRQDLTGKPYGLLTVVRFAGVGGHRQSRWVCRCECGREIVTDGASLIHDRTKSCGCERSPPDPAANHRHPEHSVWEGMKRRCHCRRDAAYPHYGGRGIRVCERWLKSFKAFLADMGARPSPAHTIDRKDNDKGYEPGNCRWATWTEQHRNRRNNKLLTFDGQTMPLSAWAEKVGLPAYVVASRLRVMRWSIERALTTPARKLSPRRRA